MKLINHAQKMIGIARDRFRHQRFWIFVGEHLRCDRQQQTQVFTQRNSESTAAQQQLAQLRRRKKFYPQKRNAARQKFAPQQPSVTAKWRDYRNRHAVFKGARSDCFKPRKEHVLPCCLERRAYVERNWSRSFWFFANMTGH
ncbi:MAG: hypothetical protein AUH91_00650 [Verrucomicrobia bacterium 13_1_40CM_4_54_4]|nr:MAG: hypothetical protein AUH91_00650 [Verrucomicrobia bacterium 13_1_40CM_4_54_4]